MSETEDLMRDLLPYYYHDWLETTGALQILYSKEVLDTIKKYKTNVARALACRLADAAYNFGEEKVFKMIKIFDNNKVADTINKYEGYGSAEEVASWLADKAYFSNKEEEVFKMSEILGDNRVVDTINKYEGDVAVEFTRRLCMEAYNLNERKVFKMSEILGDEEVLDTINKYKGEDAVRIACRLGFAAYCYDEKEKVLEVARAIEEIGIDRFDDILKSIYFFE
mgnify:CR=1 FL=1